MRISRNRLNIEDGRVDNAVFKDHAEIALGSSSTVFTGTSYTINIQNGQTYSLIQNADCSFTFANPTGSGNVSSFTLILKQDQIGGWNVAWPTGMRWQGGITPSLATAPGDFDILTFFTVNGGTNWMGVQAGRDHLNGIGELWTWGSNEHGQLGRNLASTVNTSSPAQVGSATDWKLLAPSPVPSFVGAIRSNGTLWTWGRNANGQLGSNTVVSRSSPAQIGSATDWAKVASSYDTMFAIKTTGTLWAWGLGTSGQLGSNLAASASSPTQVGTQTNWSFVWGGGNNGIAIRNTGTLWAWGGNLYGRVGNNSTANVSSPAQLGAATNWKIGAIGGRASAALKTDGTLWTWGRNVSGSLGRNDTTDRSSPIQVGSSTDWAAVAVGEFHMLALKTDGTLWSWGLNANGQVGTNATANVSSPAQIGTATDWVQVATGRYHSLAIKNVGTIWSWGYNTHGQIGNNTSAHRSSPTQIGSSDANWQQVQANRNSSVVLRNPPSWTDVVDLGFPNIESSSTAVTNASTNHVFSMPSGIQAGDLLIAALGSRDDRAHTWPGGWTELGDVDIGDGSATIGWRTATGSDSLTVTTSTASDTAQCCVRISGWSSTPERSTVASGTSTSPNPGSITPSWGSAKTLFLVVTGGRGNFTVDSFPSNYSEITQRTNTSNGCFIGIGFRELETTTQDPGTFTLSGSAQWAAWTMAIRPD